jgi:hypothetical protein
VQQAGLLCEMVSDAVTQDVNKVLAQEPVPGRKVPVVSTVRLRYEDTRGHAAAALQGLRG